MSSKKLINNAVRNTRWVSSKAVKDQIFIWLFNHLVYPQIWEDPNPDADALKIGPQSRILTISSGGCNVLNYLCRQPKSITAVDLNATHLALLKLKICALRHFPDHETFFRFFGHADQISNKLSYEKFIQPNLDSQSRQYWESRHTPFGRKRYLYFCDGFYKQGLLGRFIGANHWLTRRMGLNVSSILEANSLQEQAEIFDRCIRPFFQKQLIRLLSNRSLVMYPLGIPPAQFKLLRDVSEQGMIGIILSRVEKMACNFPISENYFAWQAFGRKYDTENRKAIPDYLKEEHFASLRGSLDRLEIHHSSLSHHLKTLPNHSLDGFVFLDALDWMDRKQLTQLWREVQRTSSDSGRVVFRTTSGISPIENDLPLDLQTHWRTDELTNEKFLNRDRSSVYGGFHLYEKKLQPSNSLGNSQDQSFEPALVFTGN